METEHSKKYFLLAGFMVAIVLTRGPWIDSWVHLRDATLAVFFIAGWFFRGHLVPSLLVLTAGLVDYGAVQSGVSAWCFSPAYPFLIPTYLCLWVAGTLAPSPNISTLKEGIDVSLRLLAATLAAFILSTGSFHWLSGRYEGVAVMEQIAISLQYLPGYVGGTFFYVGIFMMGMKAVFMSRSLILSKASQS